MIVNTTAPGLRFSCWSNLFSLGIIAGLRVFQARKAETTVRRVMEIFMPHQGAFCNLVCQTHSPARANLNDFLIYNPTDSDLAISSVNASPQSTSRLPFMKNLPQSQSYACFSEPGVVVLHHDVNHWSRVSQNLTGVLRHILSHLTAY